jgi:hypothetical protein
LASLACLQPGIDPVFLTLLTLEHDVRPSDHGWIVGVTQAGMASGSLAVWRIGSRLPTRIFQLAALCALAASAATVKLEDTGALLVARGVFGFAMGVIYIQAMSNAAAIRPNGAYGAVFLLQLVLSTIAAFLLPIISQAAGAAAALTALCLVPLMALAITLLSPMSGTRVLESTTLLRIHDSVEPVGVGSWAMAGATLLFICATMMVWTFSGALAAEAGISEGVIGRAVALGSLAGAFTAFAVMRERPIVPPMLTGLVSGLFLMSPLAGAQTGQANLFILSIILLNIGSTAVIIRSSGLASAASRTPLFRRFVACTHSLGLILGPVAGSIAAELAGSRGLFIAASLAVTGGCLLLLVSQVRSAPRGGSSRRGEGVERPARPAAAPYPNESFNTESPAR